MCVGKGLKRYGHDIFKSIFNSLLQDSENDKSPYVGSNSAEVRFGYRLPIQQNISYMCFLSFVCLLFAEKHVKT